MNAKRQMPELSQDQIIKRRDDAVRRALNTPPKPHSEMKIGKGKSSASAASALSSKKKNKG